MLKTAEPGEINNDQKKMIQTLFSSDQKISYFSLTQEKNSIFPRLVATLSNHP